MNLQLAQVPDPDGTAVADSQHTDCTGPCRYDADIEALEAELRAAITEPGRTDEERVNRIDGIIGLFIVRHPGLFQVELREVVS